MKIKRWLSTMLAAVMLIGLTACGGGTNSSAGTHEPITIMDANRDYDGLAELVHEQYPEINLQIEAYHGQNTSAYMAKQLKTGDMPDIYSSTQAWNEDWQKENLIDLAQYPVTDLYNEVRMNDTEVDGATYLIPYDFKILSLCYNKTLFDKHGWKAPQSFTELQALVPQIKAAGVNVSACQMNLPGFGFQYLCNIADTVFLRTVEGRKWQEDFLSGKVNADALQSSVDYMQKWIDLGVISMAQSDMDVEDVQKLFFAGNTAFFIGNTPRLTQNEDGTGDQYAILPYLSPNGGSNMYIVQVNRYYGLSKQLAEKGNEQKLEDALHVLEVLSTLDGYQAVRSEEASAMCTLKEFEIPDDSPYHQAMEEINKGHSAPLLYSGWEDYLVTVGNKGRDWAAGKCTAADILSAFNSIQSEIKERGSDFNVCAEVTEPLDNEQTAQLIGRIFVEATDADAALISRNEWKDGITVKEENGEGVSGHIMVGPLTEEDIVSVLPTGWYGTIETITLSGSRLKKLAAFGYDLHGDGDTYPYTLVTKDGAEIDDSTTYTVVVCGAPCEVLEQNNVQSTGVVGLDAAEDYLKKLGTLSPEALQ